MYRTQTIGIIVLITIAFLLISCGGSTSGNTSAKETETISTEPKPELVASNTTVNTNTTEIEETTETTTKSTEETAKQTAATQKETPKVTVNKKAPTTPKKETPKAPVKTVKEVVEKTAETVKEKVEKPAEKVVETVKKPVEKAKEVIKKPEPNKEEVVEKKPDPAPTTKKPTLSHDLWSQLLGKYVSSTGKVDYSGFKSNKAQFNEYLNVLESNPPQSSWSRSKIIAYWINAYNAFTIKKIVDNYPVSSITKLDGGNTWKKKDINIGGKSYSLDQIEKAILIKQYKEPRVHFAVNCAAKSCPPVLNKAWTAANLESNLEKSTRKFINNSLFNDVSNAKSIKISKIFDWYAGDFGDVITFINKYAASPVKPNAKISYNEYDWGLNN